MNARTLDLRLESSFARSIVPAQGKPWHVALLIVKNQVMMPIVQGFAWAVLKDWLAIARLYSSEHGAALGRRARGMFRK